MPSSWILPGHQNSGDSCLDVSWPSVNSHLLVSLSAPANRLRQRRRRHLLHFPQNVLTSTSSCGQHFLFSPPPFRRDVWIGVDLQTRPPDLLLEQSGLDFTRDLPPSSPHASETDGPPVGNGLRAVCQRINLHPSVLGRKGRREIK